MNPVSIARNNLLRTQQKKTDPLSAQKLRSSRLNVRLLAGIWSAIETPSNGPLAAAVGSASSRDLFRDPSNRVSPAAARGAGGASGLSLFRTTDILIT